MPNKSCQKSRFIELNTFGNTKSPASSSAGHGTSVYYLTKHEVARDRTTDLWTAGIVTIIVLRQIF